MPEFSKDGRRRFRDPFQPQVSLQFDRAEQFLNRVVESGAQLLNRLNMVLQLIDLGIGGVAQASALITF